MEKRTIIIIVSVLVAAVVATGLGVLIWWLLWEPDVSVIELDGGEGIGSARYTAAFTRIRGVGDLFWWFYPTTASAAVTRPLLLWLDGVTGIPPSLLANFGMIGPYDFNLNAREDSWVNEFNILFVDAPIGTGFSFSADANQIPQSLDEHADHLLHILDSFYSTHEEYSNTPLYIVGQGSGAQIALQLAISLQNEGRLRSGGERKKGSGSSSGSSSWSSSGSSYGSSNGWRCLRRARCSRNSKMIDFSPNLRGVVLANGIVSPALALTQLGFYLEEMGYIDYVGRSAIENYSNNLTSLVSQERFPEAFDQFLTLGDYVNSAAETVAVNLGHIIEKLTRSNDTRWSKDYFGQKSYLRSLSNQDLFSFMDATVAQALGISHSTEYDDGRSEVVQASREFFMVPTVDKVEYILQNTNLTVSIYNGNLDAVSTTPGQLEWVENLQWSGQQEFRNATRQTLAVNRLVEGYFRVTDRLKFYWMNAAGQWVPRDSPAAARRVIQLITES